MAEKARVAETPDEDPRNGSGECDDIVFEHEHITVREHRNEGTISVSVAGKAPTLVQADDLRDALNEYLDGDEHESAAFPDASVTVDVDADVSAARDAIESLQTDVDALTDDLNEAAMEVGFGLPAPSPSDVQARMNGEVRDVEMVPAEPLYELAEMFQSLPVLVRGYKKGKADAGEQLEDKLDALTEEADE